MNRLGAYFSGSDSEEEKIHKKQKMIDIAPQVTISKASYPTTKDIAFNIPLQEFKPVQGPSNPFVQRQERNMMSGFQESITVDDRVFQQLHRTFNKQGYTLDPENNTFVGDTEKVNENQGKLIQELKKVKKDRVDKGTVDGDYLGPWAPYKEDIKEELPLHPDQINYTPDPSQQFDKSKLLTSTKTTKETTIFHGTQEKDYLGRSYLHVPQDVPVDLYSVPGSMENFIPKKLVHTWKGHTKSVNAIQYFPNSAHLMLSCSTDMKVKLWDVYHDRACKRTYIGHAKGVKDVSFNYDGRSFVSMGYDKGLKVWDTETGDILNRFVTKTMPHCVVFNPTERKGHLFLVGCADKKIYQYDTRAGEMVLEYAQHSGPINSLTFIDENQRFLSTSDDKSLRMWEFDVPAVIKYIAEPDMHSMPAVALSTDRKWLAGQSMDNRILIFSVLEKFKLNRKKVFTGHLIAGNSCKPGWSPDSRFLMSGDVDGKLWFWDWKSCKVFKKFKAHDGAVLSCLWHPHETSKVASCSTDGTIKFWD